MRIARESTDLIDEDRGAVKSLLQKARRGDREAFDRLIGQVETNIVKTALYLVRDRDDALDVAQEVYLKLLTHPPSVEDLDHLRGWLYRVTVNAARDLLRKRRFQLPLRAALPWLWPRDPLQSKEFQGRLVQAMKFLSFNERAAFVLRELQEMDTTEVGQVMGCKETTVRGYVHSARRKLRQFFPEYQ